MAESMPDLRVLNRSPAARELTWLPSCFIGLTGSSQRISRS
jgi:hypothetical protein